TGALLDETDQLTNIPGHFAGIAVLAGFAVYFQSQPESWRPRREFILGDDPRTKSGGLVLAFGGEQIHSDSRWTAELQVAGAYIIANGISKDATQGVSQVDLAAANDHHQLDLVIELFCQRRKANRIVGSDECAVGLEKGHRLRRCAEAKILGEVLGVIRPSDNHSIYGLDWR